MVDQWVDLHFMNLWMIGSWCGPDYFMAVLEIVMMPAPARED